MLPRTSCCTCWVRGPVVWKRLHSNQATALLLLGWQVISAYYDPVEATRTPEVNKWSLVFVALGVVAFIAYTANYLFFGITGTSWGPLLLPPAACIALQDWRTKGPRGWRPVLISFRSTPTSPPSQATLRDYHSCVLLVAVCSPLPTGEKLVKRVRELMLTGKATFPMRLPCWLRGAHCTCLHAGFCPRLVSSPSSIHPRPQGQPRTHAFRLEEEALRPWADWMS